MFRNALCLCLTAAAINTSAEHRDPFQPPAEADCDVQLTSLSGWRVLGILGYEKDFRAWLLAPEGKAIRITPAQPFPLPSWQLKAITPRSLILTAHKRCPSHALTLYTKGNRHAQSGASHRDVSIPDARFRQ